MSALDLSSEQLVERKLRLHAGDADAGPNGLQNFPVLTSARATTAGTVVRGLLQGAPSTTFRIELFASAALIGPMIP